MGGVQRRRQRCFVSAKATMKTTTSQPRRRTEERRRFGGCHRCYYHRDDDDDEKDVFRKRPVVLQRRRRGRERTRCSSFAANELGEVAIFAASNTQHHHFLGVNELAWLSSTLYALCCFGICVRAKMGDEKSIANVRNYSTLVPLAIFYGVLLIRSWTDDTLALMMPGSLEEGLRTGEVQFIPKLSGISELLSQKAASASAWAHFMLVNLFVARHATLQSLKFDLPVAHTLALCLITGPLGLLSHVLTKSIVLKLRSMKKSNTA